MAFPGSSGDGAASAAAVCCMCGDHGLPLELFRCNLCRLRLQHRYCSDLYPRVPGPYWSCNWCLAREDGGGEVGSPGKAPAAVAEEGPRPRGGGGCTTRSSFSADPGKPVKKPKPAKKGRERAVRPAAGKKRREVQAGPSGKARFRVKVRRYKLLAEVTC